MVSSGQEGLLARQTVWGKSQWSNQWACSWQNSSWDRQRIPQHPSSWCLYCCALYFKPPQRWMRYCCTERPHIGSMPPVCWCLTKYNTERSCREKPSEVEANRRITCSLPGRYLSSVTLVHLSLQNYHVSFPRLLLSSFSSSSFLNSAPSRSLCGSPVFAFCDCESFSPFLLHHYHPLSCSQLSFWFLHIYCFYVGFYSSSSSACLW